ncbi:hypothetical protein J2W28_006437 [Variovorax boronicumulans]|uniref:hypothetical protein n=1 Tax=Variovorax boronicumulans TaxID=436515 RepID=UPI00278B532E|nr:hypothetical protein [Variovorax boronicumulans]MDP9995495.1 hypothetical protein [Variovorax boronicumulans]MDQ0007262.1 hypothetical protein [Variovorax boronicumulans]
MNMDYAKLDRDNEAFHLKQMEEAMKGGAAERSFYTAAFAAHQAAVSDGLMPSRDEDGELTYSPQQGLKAACHSREDAAATLNIQLPVLRLLHQVRILAGSCLVVLLYIAYRVS